MYFKLYNKNINYFIYHLTFPVLDMLNLTSTTFSHYKKKKKNPLIFMIFGKRILNHIKTLILFIMSSNMKLKIKTL